MKASAIIPSGGALALALALAVMGLGPPAFAQAPAAFLDPALKPDARAAALVSAMTLEEKAGQLKHAAPAIPRLSVPAYNWWSEGLHGVARAGEATVFPQAIGLAATWDAPMVHGVADTIATEFRAKYVATRAANGGSAQYRGLTVWSPNINIFRDPRWGRGQETYGEDPFLTAEMGVAFATGLQGDDPTYYKTVATAKHFAVHSGPEADRHRDDIHPSAHDLEDTYLPAFKALVTRARVESVMCAYNAVDGAPACANTALLANRLRRDWGFSGHVVSDCAAIADVFLPTSHGYVKTAEQAAAVSIKAGTDLFCGEFGPDKSADIAPIVDAVRHGLLSEAELDQAVRRLFVARLKLGLFDPPARVPYFKITAAENDTPEHRALSLEAAKASLVLLKNDGLLPLKAAPARIAVIGPNADSLDALVGNYNGTPSRPVTVLAGLRARFPGARIDFVEGSGWTEAPRETVPDSALKDLKVETFHGLDLEGPATSTEAAANARFSWGRPQRQERQTSMRWTGTLVPTETGVHRLSVSGEGGYRVIVDGRTVVDAWTRASDSAPDGQVALTAGKAHAIVVEANQSGSRGDLRLQWSRPSRGADAAVAAAKAADLVVFVGGLTAKLEGEEMSVRAPGFAGGDRTSLDLPAAQEGLLERLHAVGKPVVLVLMNGSALSVNWADAHLPAIVEAWYPGGEGGRAVAGLLAGDFSPAGRLPVTFYRSADQLPPFKDYGMAGRTYRYFGGEALYPFGHGLSYTRFAYGEPVLEQAAVKAGEAQGVAVDVTNSGPRDGDEVVQLYVSRDVAGAPARSLHGFQRVHLKVGETRRVRFALDGAAMSVVAADGSRSIAPGSVTLWIGGGQPVSRLGLATAAGVEARFVVEGSAVQLSR
ncbi:glycoside hydrolase family 3 C-terminal domain-containing protein [Caulobacter sp. BE254]|uniref:glycoside hydrolase family 3 C-terminal domain-containing protein n=1 Tax=Caulobacter sp. BE254 TaxID=2817720 RepID=UPI002854B1DC|nr:glycoside hydrolase family 3 C-terminal domain-containing protein [Caulobacter sp. BE254]MDR7117655.1 beta-glucosidase [Caulobacter sp. BE254]